MNKKKCEHNCRLYGRYVPLKLVQHVYQKISEPLNRRRKKEMIRGLNNKVLTRGLDCKAQRIVFSKKFFEQGVGLQLTFIVSEHYRFICSRLFHFD